jgi:hypothetical protein
MSRLVALAGASILAITVSTAAVADTVLATSVTFSEGDPGFRVDISAPYTIGSPPPSLLRVRAGRLRLETDSGDIFAWCVDLYEDINLGGTDRLYTLGTLDGSLTSPPAPLTDDQIARVGGLAEAGDDALASAPGNKIVSAAYQAAIWQAIYGGTYTPRSSIAANNTAFTTLFNSLVADTSFSDTSGTLYQEFKNGVLQSQQLYGDDPDPVPPPIPAPAPAAFGLFGLALAGLALAKRKGTEAA